MVIMETVLSRGWSPLDAAEKAKQEDLMTNTYVAALRRLAPDVGAYVNEVCYSLRMFLTARPARFGSEFMALFQPVMCSLSISS
jgi:hypothetical protein